MSKKRWNQNSSVLSNWRKKYHVAENASRTAIFSLPMAWPSLRGAGFWVSLEMGCWPSLRVRCPSNSSTDGMLSDEHFPRPYFCKCLFCFCNCIYTSTKIGTKLKVAFDIHNIATILVLWVFVILLTPGSHINLINVDSVVGMMARLEESDIEPSGTTGSSLLCTKLSCVMLKKLGKNKREKIW